MLVVMSRWPSAPIRVLAIILTIAFAATGIARADLPKGNVVVVKSAPDALLIWDASAAVGDLMIARRSGDDGMRDLESDGIAILAARASRMHANQMELRIQYAATGVVGAPYQASTFANATQLLVLRAARTAIAARSRAWLADIAAHRAPAGLNVRVIGALPQAQ